MSAPPTDVDTGHPRKWMILSAMCLGLAMLMIDTFVVNVALPSIARDFSADLALTQWVVSACVLAIAVLPLSRNEKLTAKAREVYDLVRAHFNAQFDDTQSIGRRYRRQDEIGTPLCVTVDFQTVEEDNAVTIRDRDTMEQIRVPIENLRKALDDRLAEIRTACHG